MAGKRDARPVGRTEGGVEVGFAALAVVHQLGRDTEILQVVADIVDELEIGIAARGVEGDQALDHRTGSGPDGRRVGVQGSGHVERSEEHTSELQSLMRISYAVFCLKTKKKKITT